MALIKCSECGREVSDKAGNCPHCGCPIKKGFVCRECGNIFNEDLLSCPNCGEPVSIVEKAIPSNKRGRLKYKIMGVIMLSISLLYGLDYIFGHVLTGGRTIYEPNVRDAIMMLYSLLFALYGFIFVYLYKH